MKHGNTAECLHKIYFTVFNVQYFEIAYTKNISLKGIMHFM